MLDEGGGFRLCAERDISPVFVSDPEMDDIYRRAAEAYDLLNYTECHDRDYSHVLMPGQEGKMPSMKGKTAEAVIAAVVARLKDARRERGLSHDEVARRAGLHRSAVSLIESGKRQPTLLSCEKIALALEVSLGEIVTEAEKALRHE
jgi:DNA-binding XRE family transcriptional regulator